MSNGMKIDGDLRVNRGYEQYNASMDKEGVKKAKKINSTFTESIGSLDRSAYMPDIPSLLNGSQTSNTAHNA